MPTQPRRGMSRKQRQHLRRATDASSSARKENRAPPDAFTHAERRAQAAEAESVKLKREKKEMHHEKKKKKKNPVKDKRNASRRKRRQKKRIADLESKVKEAQEELKAAVAQSEAKARRHAEGLERVKNRSHSAQHVVRMHAKHGRAYKVEPRAIAQVLVSSGCKEGKIGDLIQDITRIVGVDLDRAMSRRTVRRAVLEGLVASQVQLEVELKYAEDVTMSSDSTSHRKTEYQSHHIHMRVPTKNPDGSVRLSEDPRVRFAGIKSAVNHSTATSKDAWLTVYEDIISS
ncbi:hypothetical protein R3P38DRAFT_3480612 [Favolaschia claudopus]|uniref:Uncharacterized protein n=1 Tax=Favolaschia claudopus TaxID=2862362 RepID=A0AAW0CBC0_9AGAR